VVTAMFNIFHFTSTAHLVFLYFRLFLFRPPGTLVPKAFCFSRDVFFNQTQDLRAPSADRHETLPRDHYLLRLDNPGPKMRGAYPKKFGGQKHAKFGPILHNFRLWSRISPQLDNISKIGKTC